MAPSNFKEFFLLEAVAGWLFAAARGERVGRYRRILSWRAVAGVDADHI